MSSLHLINKAACLLRSCKFSLYRLSSASLSLKAADGDPTALRRAYDEAKTYCRGIFKLPCHITLIINSLMNLGKKLPPDVEVDGVFTTNELDLREVKVYGFDYDYTLACYKESVDHLIYNLGRDTLVHKLKVMIIYLLIVIK